MTTSEQNRAGGTLPATPRVSLGGDYWQTDPGTPLWGFADLHAHLMAHLAFGGRALWGQPYDPNHPGPEGMEHVMGSCAPYHGGLLNVNPEFGHRPGGGWPDFIVWPRFTTLVHQQAHIDWLYRAYQGGLRLISCLAVNNELLADRTNPGAPHDDKTAIAVQVAAMKETVAFLDRTAGGPGKGWMQIAYSPDDARHIIGANHLAVVLGVEVDSLGNWRSREVFERLSQADPNRAREMIARELDELFEMGVRQITPIHLIDNAFGGTAIYLRVLEAINVFVANRHWEIENAWDKGVRYRVDFDGDGLVEGAERTIILSGPQLPGRVMNRRTLIDDLPGIQALLDETDEPHVPGGHANARGLNIYGALLLQEMMKRGMVIDIDHMSANATDAALDLVEARDYPVICSHTGLRDIQYTADVEFRPDLHPPYATSDARKLAHEGAKHVEQIERVAKLGGLVAPILNQGDVAGLKGCLPELASKVPLPFAGSATSWAQAYLYAAAKMGGRGVALGSDINGAACLPGPRFGTMAAFGARSDAARVGQRRAEIDRQINGVSYDQPLKDYRWFRFEPSGEGAYDDEERLIWRALAQYTAGFNPWDRRHGPDDEPTEALLEGVDIVQFHREQEQVDNLTLGLLAADDYDDWSPEQIKEWPLEQRAAYFARQEIVEPSAGVSEKVLDLAGKIEVIWKKWRQMDGNNPPLQRLTAGPRRDWDINIDGMAHYGLLPDFLQDLRNVGLSTDDLAPLFRGANDYVEMWTKCVQRSKTVVTAPMTTR